MNVEVKQIQITLSGNEAYNIALSIMYDLKESINRHWNHLQQDIDGEQNFYSSEADKIKCMNTFFTVSGFVHMVGHTDNAFKEMFANRRKERKDNS